VIAGQVAGEAQQPVPLHVVAAGVAEQPDLGVKQVSGTRPVNLVDHRFEEGHEVGSLGRDSDLAGLTEHVDTVGAGADGFEGGDRVGGAA
jgi:hypothetical protein